MPINYSNYFYTYSDTITNYDGTSKSITMYPPSFSMLLSQYNPSLITGSDLKFLATTLEMNFASGIYVHEVSVSIAGPSITATVFNPTINSQKYPVECPVFYTNPGGNLPASGYYRSFITQRLANNFPQWMHLRQNDRSVGQQLLSSPALLFDKLENDIEFNIRSKFINTVPTDEIDVLYKIKIPSNFNLDDPSFPGIRCIASASGNQLSGGPRISVKEVNSLEEFYYQLVPTRLTALDRKYMSDVNSKSWNLSASGVRDLEQKHYDIWKMQHNLTWCYTYDNSGKFRKQDAETMEDYEVYDQGIVPGKVTGMDFYKGMLWCISNEGSNSYLSMVSTKTQVPPATILDTIAVFDITSCTDTIPSGILMDSEGNIRVCDSNRGSMIKIAPRYDYCIIDKVNKYIYFREDYRYSGVFIGKK